jgi:hypothetical protein
MLRLPAADVSTDVDVFIAAANVEAIVTSGSSRRRRRGGR